MAAFLEKDPHHGGVAPLDDGKEFGDVFALFVGILRDTGLDRVPVQDPPHLVRRDKSVGGPILGNEKAKTLLVRLDLSGKFAGGGIRG